MKDRVVQIRLLASDLSIKYQELPQQAKAAAVCASCLLAACACAPLVTHQFDKLDGVCEYSYTRVSDGAIRKLHKPCE